MFERRILIVSAGLLGAIGVATAAAASHQDDVRNIAAISAMSLAHAPALLAIALAGRGRALLVAGVLMAIGCAVFVADLASRQWIGHPLFPGAAPIGGGGLILSWLGVVVAGVLNSRKD
jgi:uncharacterized membrane protein YgdD (TMEM256/DUF423 family)